MPFADLHCHPTFKIYLERNSQKSAWDNFDIKVDFDIFDSQSSLTQLANGNVKLAFAAIYGIERVFSVKNDIGLIRTFSRHVSPSLFKDIKDVKINYYNEIFNQVELIHCKGNWNSPVHPEQSVNIIQDMKSFDGKKLNIIFAIEGCHNFYNTWNSAPHYDEIKANLIKLKGTFFRFFYITLAHFQDNILCNQAYALKLIDDEAVHPKQLGISPNGIDFITQCLNNGAHEKRILIDVKHMSLVSRLHYYDFLKKRREQTGENVPIIFSHGACTGFSYTKIGSRIKSIKTRKSNCYELEYNKDSSYPGCFDLNFNPWSINLYDEEIEEIIRSRGMIGIIVDTRVLGFGKIESEIISGNEISHFGFSADDPRIFKVNFLKKVGGFFNGIKETVRELGDNLAAGFGIQKGKCEKNPEYKETQMRNMAINIMHILRVGSKMADVADREYAFQCISIGSDFDGLVEPVCSATRADMYPELASKLEQAFNELGGTFGVQIPNPKAFVEQIMYFNLYNFVTEHYN